jgi:hypothetical protein
MEVVTAEKETKRKGKESVINRELNQCSIKQENGKAEQKTERESK